MVLVAYMGELAEVGRLELGRNTEVDDNSRRTSAIIRQAGEALPLDCD